MDKKPYNTPELKPLGDITELTKGQGWHGSDDQFWCFSWGDDDRPPGISG